MKSTDNSDLKAGLKLLIALSTCLGATVLAAVTETARVLICGEYVSVYGSIAAAAYSLGLGAIIMGLTLGIASGYMSISKAHVPRPEGLVGRAAAKLLLREASYYAHNPDEVLDAMGYPREDDDGQED